MTSRYSRPLAALLAMTLVFVGFAATGCTQGASSSSAIATVNGVAIPASAVDAQIARYKKASPASFEGTTGAQVELQYKAQILDALIKAQLIADAAKSLGVTVSTKQVDDYVSQLQKQYGGEKALQAAMTSAGIDLSTLKDEIKKNFLQEAVSAKVTTGTITVTDKEIKDYFNANKKQFETPAQVHAAHILISATDTVLAAKVLKEAKAGANFADLAKKYSIDPGTKDNGGDLGWAAPSSYVPEFASAVESMKVNQIKEAKSSFGIHIIELLGTRPASQKTLAESKATIEQTIIQRLRAEKFAAYLDGLRAKAKIVINDAAIKKIIDQNTAKTTTTTP